MIFIVHHQPRYIIYFGARPLKDPWAHRRPMRPGIGKTVRGIRIIRGVRILRLAKLVAPPSVVGWGVKLVVNSTRTLYTLIYH